MFWSQFYSSYVICSMHLLSTASLTTVGSIPSCHYSLQTSGSRQSREGQEIKRTVLNYRKVKSLALGHSIKHWQSQTKKKTPQIPQIRKNPSAVCTSRTLNLSFCNIHHFCSYLFNACDLHRISGSTRANTLSIIFTVPSPCVQRTLAVKQMAEIFVKGLLKLQAHSLAAYYKTFPKSKTISPAQGF